jgi:hypothetical protein
MGKMLDALGALFVLMTHPQMLEAGIQNQQTSISFLTKARIALEKGIKDMFGNFNIHIGRLTIDNRAFANMILAGIMIEIVGFAMLTIGLYITFAIQTSMPGLNNTLYNTTQASINNYMGIAFSVMGMALMILGFVVILFSLKSLQGDSQATR